VTTLERSTAATPLVEIIVDEDLTRAAAASLHLLLTDALELRPQQLVVDLTACHYADAFAVDVLLTAHRHAWAVGSRLTLRGPSPRMRRLLELTHTDRVFNVTPVPSETDGVPERTARR
jgi:anti-anti-sigma factor